MSMGRALNADIGTGICNGASRIFSFSALMQIGWICRVDTPAATNVQQPHQEVLASGVLYYCVACFSPRVIRKKSGKKFLDNPHSWCFVLRLRVQSPICGLLHLCWMFQHLVPTPSNSTKLSFAPFFSLVTTNNKKNHFDLLLFLLHL